MNPYHNHSDAELIDLFKAGDHAAFEVIYQRYVKDLYRFARKNIQSREDCEEMVHDVFESLITRRNSLNIQSLKHYLFTSIRYMIIRHINHKAVKRKYAQHYNWFEVTYETLDKESVDATSVMESIHKQIETLPDRCRTAIQLRLRENLSNGEIAERMQINKRTVELYITQAFRHLRQSYDEIYKPG